MTMHTQLMAAHGADYYVLRAAALFGDRAKETYRVVTSPARAWSIGHAEGLALHLRQRGMDATRASFAAWHISR